MNIDRMNGQSLVWQSYSMPSYLYAARHTYKFVHFCSGIEKLCDASDGVAITY